MCEALSVQNLRVPEDVLVAALGEDSWNKSGRLPGVLSFARCGPPPQNGVLVPTEQVEHVICGVVRNVVQGGKSLPQSLWIGQERMQQLFAAHGYLL